VSCHFAEDELLQHIAGAAADVEQDVMNKAQSGPRTGRIVQSRDPKWQNSHLAEMGASEKRRSADPRAFLK
jgi:hypothetical protein